ncbi:MAG: hypothetical protein ACXW3D_00560 [Caulobacteraceae bacterium]
MTVRFPIAANAELALSAALGRAGREREAEALLGGRAVFVRELSGPAFATREAALEAYKGRIDQPGGAPVQPEDRYCELVEVLAEVKGKPAKGGQAAPVNDEGRRWPKPPAPLKTLWRLSVGYWRPVTEQPVQPTPDQARQARKNLDARQLDAVTLRRMTQQPLKPVKAQQPLDFGLFEVQLPESPGQFIPDE